MSILTTLNDRYQLENRLGSGGMSVVYRARDLTLERQVAIKVLRKDYSDTPEFRERFRQEARAAANLTHPNIVTVHDFGYYANQLFIVMEYVPGTDLKALLRQRGVFGIPEALDLIVQACNGIGYAHRAGLVHCDVKPQNMLVTPDKRLKVADFGIARALTTISPDERNEVVWGSPQYFSPEQASGLAPSPASDVYSLGLILYEMLTGQLPFTAATPEELGQMHREALPPSPRKLNPAIPLTLEQIVLKVLSKEPSARYRTADQLGRVLAGFIQPGQGWASIALDTGRNRPAPPSSQAATVIPAAQHPARVFSSPGVEAREYRQPSGTAPVASTSINSETPDLLVISPPHRSERLDWSTWLLALLALLVVGGLLPFWLWVFYMINPPL